MAKWFLVSLVALGCAPDHSSITIESQGDGLITARACFIPGRNFFCALNGSEQATINRGAQSASLFPEPPGFFSLSESLIGSFDGDPTEGELFEATWSSAGGERVGSVRMPPALRVLSPQSGQVMSVDDLTITWESASNGNNTIDVTFQGDCAGGNFNLGERDIKDDGEHKVSRRVFKDNNIGDSCVMDVIVSRASEGEVTNGNRKDSIRATVQTVVPSVTIVP